MRTPPIAPGASTPAQSRPALLNRPSLGLCLLLGSSTLGLIGGFEGRAYAADAPAAPAAGATATNTTPASGNSGDTDEIVVTGQAMPGSVIGDIAPENQINQAEIASYGVDSINDLLDEIADQTTSIQGRDSSSGPVVLVNGKRISGVNEIGDLPVESVLRVDILPEEVAIKYGYDAQQKVVNIILKRHFLSKSVNLSGGMSAQGGGADTSGAFTYTRIHDNDRVNVVGRVKTQAAILESDRDITPDATNGVTEAGGIADDRAGRTLQASTRTYELNSSIAHDFGGSLNGSINLRGSYETSNSLDGYATGDLTIPADNPYNTTGSESTITRYLNNQALRQRTDTGTVSAGGTLNYDLSTRWKLSTIASYTHTETDTHSDTGFDTDTLQDAITAGDTSVDPYGTLSNDLLGSTLTNRAKSNNDTGSASVLLFGKLLKLPAGDMGVSLRLGGDFTQQSSTSVRNGDVTSSDANRTDGIAKMSVDLPIASKKNGVLGFLGTLSANFNGGVTQVSNFGSMGTFGYGLTWKPTSTISLVAAMNEDRQAPTVANLSDPTLTTSNVRVYDYVTGKSVLVTSISGGNANLKADDRHTFKVGLTAQIMSTPKLNFIVNYADSRDRNAIITPGGVTQALEDAFPDRFTRDSDGNLTEVDARPINVYEERVQQLRWGFNLSAQLRKPKRPARPPWAGAGGPGEWRRRWEEHQQSGENGQKAADSKTAPSTTDDHQTPPDGDITVTGQRPGEGDDHFGGPPPGGPPDGFDGPPPDGGPDGDHGPPPDGFGPPPGGGPGGPGGPGGFGGPGGRGGRGFSGGSDNGMRLLASLYHTWILRDDVQLTQGGETIDLLNGGTITGSATPQHKVTGQIGVMDNGVGMRFEGTWQSATKVVGDTTSSGSGDLHFSSLFTLDYRLFANLQNRFPGKSWAKGTRVSLSVTNIFNQRQHVTDGTGATPYAYQGDYLDPMGRTLLLSVRRIF